MWTACSSGRWLSDDRSRSRTTRQHRSRSRHHTRSRARWGGVPPGTTPPESAGTSGLSAPEPETRKGLPATGWMTLGAVVLIVIVFVAVIIGLIAAIV
ncbi:DUF6480 family protein [Rhodococcus phenolicus]|uniref:DUF6480 family protein n=1 Tax=Rhodococcus phenolicus TaxID=263849 RepID=UPI000AE5315F